MKRLYFLSLILMAAACGPKSKRSQHPPASGTEGSVTYDQKTQLVSYGSSVAITCEHINVFDTLWKTHAVDAAVTVIDPAAIPEDTEALSLEGSKVVDLSPVFGRRFKSMDLTFSDFRAWDQLARFPELESLIVGGPQVNVAELFTMRQALPRLKRLTIFNGSLQQINPDFTAFPNLESLALSMVVMDGLSSLADALRPLRSLEALYLDKMNPFLGNPPLRLNPLVALTQLGHLTVRSGPYIDWESLNSMTFLTSLQVRSPRDEFQPQHMTALTELETLDLSYTQWSSYDFTPQTKLKNLCLASNKLTDLTAVSRLDQLELLDVRANLIEDLSPLKGLSRLQTLVLVQNYERDVELGFNPVIHPQKRSTGNCPQDAQAKVLKEFCTPRDTP